MREDLIALRPRPDDVGWHKLSRHLPRQLQVLDRPSSIKYIDNFPNWFCKKNGQFLVCLFVCFVIFLSVCYINTHPGLISFLTTLITRRIDMSKTLTPVVLAQAKNLLFHLIFVIKPSPSNSVVDLRRDKNTFSCKISRSSPVTNLLPEPDL